MKVMFEADDVKMAEPADKEGPGFLFKEGEYEIKIAGSNAKKSKKGNDMIVLTIEDLETGDTRNEYVVLSQKWKIAQIAQACGISQEQLLSQGLDFPGDLMFKKARIEIKKTGETREVGDKEYEEVRVYWLKPTDTSSVDDEDLPF